MICLIWLNEQMIDDIRTLNFACLLMGNWLKKTVESYSIKGNYSINFGVR